VLLPVLLVVTAGVQAPVARAHDPSTDYRWVGDDEAPAGREATLTRAVSSVWTSDLQAVLTLAPELLGDATTVAIAPRDARSVAELPAGLFANGNVYEVTLDADREVVGQLDLAVPHDATTVLVSRDAESWDVAIAASMSPGHVSVPLGEGGLFLAATDHAVVPAGGASDALRTVVLLGAPAMLLLLIAVARRRRRSEALEPVSP